MHYLVFQFPEIYCWSEETGYGEERTISEEVEFPVRPVYIYQEYAPGIIHARNEIIDRIKNELLSKKEYEGYEFSFLAPHEPATIESDFDCANMFDYEMMVQLTNRNKYVAPHRPLTKNIYYGLIETAR